MKLMLVCVAGGLLLGMCMLGGMREAYHAFACYEGGRQYGVATEWNPIDGCTVSFLGARIRVGD